MLQNLGQVIWIGLVVVALVAFRLLWGHPAFNAMIRYFPESWQRWLLDQPRPSANKPH
jgi:cytochrome b